MENVFYLQYNLIVLCNFNLDGSLLHVCSEDVPLQGSINSVKDMRKYVVLNIFLSCMVRFIKICVS